MVTSGTRVVTSRARWLLGATLAAASVALAARVALAASDGVPAAAALTLLTRAISREARLSLAGRVLEVVTYPPRPQPRTALGALPPPPQVAPALVARNFRSSVSAGEPVAGRRTWRLDFVPLAATSPRFSFWIDREWGVRLAFLETDAAGARTASAAFVRADGPPLRRPRPLEVRRAGPNPQLERRVRASLGDLRLPAGFRVVGARRVRAGPGPAGQALELRVSNGLSVAVVTVSPLAVRGGPKLAVRRAGTVWVWVVGNLPQPILDDVAGSVRAPPDLMAVLAEVVP